MNISIEKGIKPPIRNALPPLPLDDMLVGDSFVLPMEQGDKRTVAALRQRICRYQRANNGKKFAVHQDPQGMRVYRRE